MSEKKALGAKTTPFGYAKSKKWLPHPGPPEKKALGAKTVPFGYTKSKIMFY